MELKGKIIQLLPLASGESQRGPWKKQEYIIETDEQYPRKVCASLWGDKIDQFALAAGDDVLLSINIESREYNGRWYTDVRIWNAQKVAATTTTPATDGTTAPLPNSVPPAQTAAAPVEESEDDLPF